MPVPPAGEASLRALSERFADAEARIRALLAQAPAGDRRELLTEALAILVALRREDARGPVATAYLAAFKEAVGLARRRRAAVDDLAGSLALKLDRGARTASASAREAFSRVHRGQPRGDARERDHGPRRRPRHALAARSVGGYERGDDRQAGIDPRPRRTRSATAGRWSSTSASAATARSSQARRSSAKTPLPPFHPSCTCVAGVA